MIWIYNNTALIVILLLVIIVFELGIQNRKITERIETIFNEAKREIQNFKKHK